MSKREAVSLLLTPADVAMFRDSRPFGQTPTGSTSTFPLPRATAGAVRTWLLESQGFQVASLRGGPTTKERLRQVVPPDAQWVVDAVLSGPFPFRPVETYLPAPFSIVRIKQDSPRENDRVGQLAPLRKAPPGWSVPAEAPRLESFRPAWLRTDQEWEEFPDSYLACSVVQNLLTVRNYALGVSQICSAEGFWAFEDRLGIGMDPMRGVTEAELLYTSLFLRLREEVALRVDVAAERTGLLSLLRHCAADNPWLRIGGEGKFARVQVEEPSALPSAPTWPPTSGRFYTWLVTPGLFKEGLWYPKRLGEQCVLVSAIVGRPLALSGWDTAHNVPLGTRYAVRAGAVHFWEAKPGEQSLPDPHGTSISDDEDDQQAGWGICLRGEWDYVE